MTACLITIAVLSPLLWLAIYVRGRQDGARAMRRAIEGVGIEAPRAWPRPPPPPPPPRVHRPLGPYRDLAPGPNPFERAERTPPPADLGTVLRRCHDRHRRNAGLPPIAQPTPATVRR